jgi:hypothetical protein
MDKELRLPTPDTLTPSAKFYLPDVEKYLIFNVVGE